MKKTIAQEYKKNVTIERIGIFFIIFSIIITSLFFYWTIAEYKALDIKVQPVPILKGHERVKAGDFSFLVFNYCKNTDAVGRVVVTLVSTRSAILTPPYDDTTKKICVPRLLAPMIVPPQTTPDKYHYHFRIVYPVNPIKNVVVEFDSAPLTVL